MSPSSEEPLHSWKEIGAYLQRDATTVRRWEKYEGLPVHRHTHKARASVYAYPSELDAWRASRHVMPKSAPALSDPQPPRSVPPPEPTPMTPSPPPPGPRQITIPLPALIVAVILTMLAIWLWSRSAVAEGTGPVGSSSGPQRSIPK